MPHDGVSEVSRGAGNPGEVRMEHVDGHGDGEPGDQGQDVGQVCVALTQPLLEPDIAVVPDATPVSHHTRPWYNIDLRIPKSNRTFLKQKLVILHF